MAPGVMVMARAGQIEFAELAGHAAFAAVFPLHQDGSPAVVFRQVLVPAEFRVLHRDSYAGAGQFLLVAGFAQQSQNEVLDGDPETAKDGLQVEPLSEGNLRALDRFEGHNSDVVGMKKVDYLTKYRMAAVMKMLMTASSKKTIQPSFITWS